MLKPLNNRIVIKPVKDTETASGFILVEGKEKPVKGIVVVGNDLVKEGDKILFSRFGYDETEVDGETYYVVSSMSVLAIFE